MFLPILACASPHLRRSRSILPLSSVAAQNEWVRVLLMSVCVLSPFDVEDIPSVCRCQPCYYFNTRNDKMYSHSTHTHTHSQPTRDNPTKMGQRTEEHENFLFRVTENCRRQYTLDFGFRSHRSLLSTSSSSCTNIRL